MQTFLNQVIEYATIKDEIQDLEYALDNHDCKLTTDGWCECVNVVKKIKYLLVELKHD